MLASAFVSWQTGVWLSGMEEKKKVGKYESLANQCLAK